MLSILTISTYSSIDAANSDDGDDDSVATETSSQVADDMLEKGYDYLLGTVHYVCITLST